MEERCPALRCIREMKCKSRKWNSNGIQRRQRRIFASTVSFEEAASVFNDVLAAVYDDPDHSTHEGRYLTIGTSATGRLIHIAFADRGQRIRIINAPKVTKQEKQLYEEENR
jgi:uncharacterized DUF497 family protein